MLHLPVVALAQRVMLMNQRPECPGVIHLHRVTKLMHHNVADKIVGQKEQLAVQGYRAA